MSEKAGQKIKVYSESFGFITVTANGNGGYYSFTEMPQSVYQKPSTMKVTLGKTAEKRKEVEA